VSVATYRRSGSLVATPLWFGWTDRGIAIVTPANAGKIKRLQRDSRVTVAPCGSQGRVTGPTIPARGRVLAGAEAARALRAIARRYPVPRFLLETTMRRRGGGLDAVYIEITPA
jgi:uncharacterized protein